jgi:hydrogenase maturation protease
MSTRLVIGCGNALRSDDGFGWKAANAIGREVTSADVEILAVQQLTPELAELAARSSRVLFLDASHQGQPGEIRVERIRRDPDFQPGAISHQLSPPALLELAYRYYGGEPLATLVTVTGENFALGEQFSPPVQNAWRPCLERVLEWVRAL